MMSLTIFAGRPGTGKSSIARGLARATGAVWLRIDSVEQAIRESGSRPVDDAGYRAAYAVARDNLNLGHSVIADCVNPWMLTRNAWRDTGLRAGARVVEVETLCSDHDEHRRRVETRASDVPGLVLPDWQAVAGHDYQAWTRDRLVIDTAGRCIADCVEIIVDALSTHGSP